MIEKLLLGCCGSIAVFGLPTLIVTLRMVHGIKIQAVMTESAQEFVTAYALEVLTGNPVQTKMFDSAARNHINAVASYPVFLIAPATANVIAKIANGIADDIVSLYASVCLGSETKLMIAPAMNPVMWNSPILRANVSKLIDTGAHFVGPSPGIEILTMQETLVGGMASATELVDALSELSTASFSASSLQTREQS